MSTRRYTKVTIEEVIELYNHGYNFSQIATKLGCCRNTVRKRVNEYVSQTGNYIYISSKPTTGIYASHTIWQLWNDGQTVKEIAITGNVSRSYVYKVLKDYTDASR